MDEISIKKATMISFISKYSNITTQLLYTAILARILTPGDYGIVAVLTVFTNFFALIADMGIGPAVIHNKELDGNDINNIYIYTFYLGIAVAILFTFFSYPLSIFYENEVYIKIGALISVSLFFNTLNIIPNALLLKNQKFKTLGIRLVVISIICGIPTIIFALLGFKFYAIIFNSILVAFITYIWNYKTAKLKFKLTFERKSIVKIKDFSKYQFAFSFLNYFSRNLDNLLIGKYIGNAALGYYDKAYKLMLFPVGNLTQVITPVLFPILSRHQDDKSYIYMQYMKVVKILSLLGVFITAYCFFAGKEIILIMFGDQWAGAIPCFRILALSVWAQMITSSAGSIFQSLGKTRLMFISGACTAIVSVIAIIIGINFQDITIVAACVVIAYNLHFFIVYFFLIKYGFRYRLRELFKKILPDMVVLIITVAGLYLVSNNIKIDNLILAAILKGILGVMAFGVGLLITNQHKVFLQLVKKKKKE